VLVVFACEGSFGAFLSDNSKLFCFLLEGIMGGGGLELTFGENGLPFIITLLDRERHLGCAAGTKEAG
jgi:hypothetical protein